MPINGNPFEIKQTKEKVAQILQRVPYIENPAVPELAFKPDFMINLESQLIFTEVAFLTYTENVDWKTLRLIEHLFEVKLFYGNKSNFNLIVLNRDNWKSYCIELLENFFDKVTYDDHLENTSDIQTTPKTSNFELWDLEREFERSRYKEFNEEYLRKFGYLDVKESTIEDELLNRLLQHDYRFRRDYPVRNLKNHYLGRAIDLKFYFDFFVNEKIVEIKSFRKISDVTLQNLLIKSRLIRYTKVDDSIMRTPTNITNMILVINGDLSGPRYDKFRYLRMLTNAGWDVSPLSDFSDNRMEGFLL